MRTSTVKVDQSLSSLAVLCSDRPNDSSVSHGMKNLDGRISRLENGPAAYATRRNASRIVTSFAH